jgi:hypothetical protein
MTLSNNPMDQIVSIHTNFGTEKMENAMHTFAKNSCLKNIQKKFTSERGVRLVTFEFEI